MSRPPEGPAPRAGTTPGGGRSAVSGPGSGRDLVPVTTPVADPDPGVVDLVTRGARVGLDAAGLLAAEVADATVRIARAVLPPAVASRPLDAVGDAVERRREAARRREDASRDDARRALERVVRQVVELVIDQIDMDALVDRIPVDRVVDRIDVNEIAARIDVDAIVARLDIGAIANEAVEQVDMGAIVRDSTTGLAGETIDAVRVQVMGLDLFVARVVDRVLRRREPRALALADYDVHGPEIRVPRGLQ